MSTQTMFFTLITLSLCAHSMAFLSSFKGPKKLGEEPSIDCGRVPPLFWCKSERLAEKCDVSDQCKKYVQESENKKPLITLFYEGLCPGCQAFINGPLYDDVYAKFGDYVRIELVPYGNANLLKNGSISCQHGPKECEINLHEECAIHFLPDPVPFVHCVEVKLQMGIDFKNATEVCYQKLHVSHIAYDQIQHCIRTKRGHDLQLESAKRTSQAWPDQHKFVPWVLFNNVSLSSEQGPLHTQLPLVICESLVGKRPDICSQIDQEQRMEFRSCAKD